MAWIVSAGIAAYGAIGAAAAAGTVAAWGAAAVAVAEVGLAMTVVGTITKSKELVKIGRVLSVVGGIGSLATSAISAFTSTAVTEAGSAAATAGLEGAAENAIADAAGGSLNEVYSVALGDVAGEAAASGAADLAGGSASDFLANTAADAATDTAASTLTQQAAENIPKGLIDTATNAGADAASTSAVEVAAPKGLIQQASAPAVTGGAEDSLFDAMGKASADQLGPGLTNQNETGLFGKVQDFWKTLDPDSKKALLSTVPAMGQYIQNSEKMDLEKEKQKFEKDFYDQRQANANAVPQLKFKKPNLNTSTGNGMINVIQPKA